ncbi:uncharacterized protein LOC131016430 [Salvia miltiorrhiza]|uniref:uncharacterized protein LOC131016430 n=1 Tax=Salvia miltiorrhiza TaxID=226208 RepID=UPI0025ABF010|nr:uncharacterized protein LOC131016430 [Salvia miltiorrhiza]XP_057801106.1 uncharacterized protein LOC131016430 [Salvia miltiorrhiza]XP_057801107.1 uncharacterized protein LOC131016430 [Salvia miltiorrhiza]
MGKSSPQLSGRRRELKGETSDDSKGKKPEMEPERGGQVPEQRRLPLSEVVDDCIHRWFQDTLKEAKTGDINMQVLVGQMYYYGYGIAKDANKGRIWISRASRVRASVWKVSNKRPGYNASDSDSDSDELVGNS